MRKTIWMAWLQGAEAAPPVVRACIDSWITRNPGWEVRVVDAHSVTAQTGIFDAIDLDRQEVTPASFSDILRMGLLREHGGVWADATTFCNRPLDDWLPDAAASGFFAFADPAKNRPMSSWFIASEADHPFLVRLHGAVLRYWQDRTRADNYFWFHILIRGILQRSPEMAAHWAAVPKHPARDAMRLFDLAHLPPGPGRRGVDWSVPVFKLSHKVPASPDAAPLLHDVLDLARFPQRTDPPAPNALMDRLAPAASLPGPKVKIRGPISASQLRKIS